MVVDMTNKRYGRFVVLSRTENDKHGNAQWLCQCDCGNTKVVLGSSLRRGLILSCGCYHKDKLSSIQTTHGNSKTRLYCIWQKMKARCTNPNDKHYSYYGGRGICICKEWINDFAAFQKWSLSHGYNDTLTLDRIDFNGMYEPDNCRWATRKAQQNNTRRTHLYTINGETKSIAEWCRVYNVPHERTRRRVVNEGWDIEKALTIPPLNRNRQPR